MSIYRFQHQNPLNYLSEEVIPTIIIIRLSWKIQKDIISGKLYLIKEKQILLVDDTTTGSVNSTLSIWICKGQTEEYKLN